VRRAAVSVLGAGGWGTALAILLARRGMNVTLWARSPEIAAALERDRENRRLLPNVPFPGGLRVTGNLADAAGGARDALVIAVPSHGLGAIAGALRGLWRSGGPPLVSVTKGFDPETRRRPSEVLRAVLEAGEPDVCALSGPSYAPEAVRDVPTAVVAACPHLATAERIQAIFHAPRFRVYTHRDLVGVELGGALKNVVAVACGIADGLGFGDNTRAALVTRGLAEITRLGVALGARRETFMGLAGLGDLVVTCTGAHSRNRALGRRIGVGERLAEALAASPQVVEGVAAARTVRTLAREHRVEMPIAERVHAVLFEGMPPSEALRGLLEREARSEEEREAPRA
jgi:glycerol-3-phosphate dehydrogenase (NAD(P)+)